MNQPQPPPPPGLLTSGLSRRGVIRTAAWATPAIAVTSTAPAYAASICLDASIALQGIRTTSAGAGAVVDPPLTRIPGLANEAGTFSGGGTKTLAAFLTDNAITNPNGTLTFSGTYGTHSSNPLSVPLHWNTAKPAWNEPALTVQRTVTWTRTRVGTVFTFSYAMTENWKYVISTVDAVVTNDGDVPLTDVHVDVAFPLNVTVDLGASHDLQVEMYSAEFSRAGQSSFASITVPEIIDLDLLGRVVHFTQVAPILYPNTGSAAPHTELLRFKIIKTTTVNSSDPVSLSASFLTNLLTNITNPVALLQNLLSTTVPASALDIPVGNGEVFAPWGIAYGTPDDESCEDEVSAVERFGFLDLFT